MDENDYKLKTLAESIGLSNLYYYIQGNYYRLITITDKGEADNLITGLTKNLEYDLSHYIVIARFTRRYTNAKKDNQ